MELEGKNSSPVKVLGGEQSSCREINEVWSSSSWSDQGTLRTLDTTMDRQDMEDLGVYTVLRSPCPRDLSCSLLEPNNMQMGPQKYSCPHTVQQNNSATSLQALGRSSCQPRRWSSCYNTTAQDVWDHGRPCTGNASDMEVQVLSWVDNIPCACSETVQICVGSLGCGRCGS